MGLCQECKKVKRTVTLCLDCLRQRTREAVLTELKENEKRGIYVIRVPPGKKPEDFMGDDLID